MTAGFPEPIWPVDLPRCRIWPMEGEDGPLLQELFDDLEAYESVFGERGAADAVSTFVALPEGVGYEDKLLLGLWANGGLLGMIDCITRYPGPADWTLGAMVVAERHRRTGIGRSALGWLETTARERGASRMRANLRSGNALGRAFLEAVGYRMDPMTDHVPRQPSRVLVAVKTLDETDGTDGR